MSQSWGAASWGKTERRRPSGLPPRLAMLRRPPVCALPGVHGRLRWLGGRAASGSQGAAALDEARLAGQPGGQGVDGALIAATIAPATAIVQLGTAGSG
jgi:hypothetical protein